MESELGEEQAPLPRPCHPGRGAREGRPRWAPRPPPYESAIKPHVPIRGSRTGRAGAAPPGHDSCRERRAMPAPPDFPGQDRSLRWLIHPAPPCSLVDQLSELLQRPVDCFSRRSAFAAPGAPNRSRARMARDQRRSRSRLCSSSSSSASVSPSAALPASTRPSRDHPGHSEKMHVADPIEYLSPTGPAPSGRRADSARSGSSLS